VESQWARCYSDPSRSLRRWSPEVMPYATSQMLPIPASACHGSMKEHYILFR
jgi:hypothetical protein